MKLAVSYFSAKLCAILCRFMQCIWDSIIVVQKDGFIAFASQMVKRYFTPLRNLRKKIYVIN